MKKTIFCLIIGMVLAMGSQANQNEDLIGAMLFVVSPANEGAEEYEAAISVCKCALFKAKENWSIDDYSNLSNDIIDYAEKVDSVMNSKSFSGSLMSEGLPDKSENLLRGLKKLMPYIMECEEKFDTRVEI